MHRRLVVGTASALLLLGGCSNKRDLGNLPDGGGGVTGSAGTGSGTAGQGGGGQGGPGGDTAGTSGGGTGGSMAGGGTGGTGGTGGSSGSGGTGGGGSGGTGGGSGGAVDAGSDTMDAPVDMQSDSMDAGPTCLPASATPPDAGLVLIADTQAGFSGTQGGCSWSYGYTTPATGDGFQLMTDWDPGYPGWWVKRGTFWTHVHTNRQHANALTNTTTSLSAVDQWSVRRWRSSVTGTITITGSVHKVVGQEGGNGVDARIFVDGTQVYTRFINGSDNVGVSFAFSAAVVAGSTVDFVLDPHQSNDLSDTTFFAAQIWR